MGSVLSDENSLYIHIFSQMQISHTVVFVQMVTKCSEMNNLAALNVNLSGAEANG